MLSTYAQELTEMQEFVTASVNGVDEKKKLLKITMKPDKSMCCIVRTSTEMFWVILDAPPTTLLLPVGTRFVSF